MAPAMATVLALALAMAMALAIAKNQTIIIRRVSEI